MRKALLTTVSAIAIGSSGATSASSAPFWLGPYLGINAGYAWGNSDPFYRGQIPLAGVTPGTPPTLRPNGFIGGAQLGYNWVYGVLLLGAELDFDGLSSSKSAGISPFFAGKGGGNTVSWSSSYDWLATARLRAGLVVSGNWLLFITGGLAVTRVNDSYNCTSTNFTCASFAMLNTFSSKGETLYGGTIGGGVELRV